MPNYPTHARWGRIGAAAVASAVGGGLFVLSGSPLLAGGAALGAAVATFVGSVFPDIDHHKSVPRRKAGRAIRLLVVVGIASLVALNFAGLESFAETAVTELGDPGVPPAALVGAATVLVALVAAGLVDPALDALTRKHRGWTHSAPVMFVVTAILAGAAGLLTGDLSPSRQVAAVVVVATFFAGCLVHIGLDGELW